MITEFQTGFVRRSRVRLIRQTERAECGLASLAMVAAFHGQDVDLASLRQKFRPSLRGATLKTLIAHADDLGLAPRPVKLPIEQLGNLQLPAILHWNLNHFVVLARVRGGKALIYDPEGRTHDMPLREVSKHFTGVALELRPTAEFQPSRERSQLKLTQLWNRAVGFKRALLQTVVLTIVMQAFVLASPYYMQVALDSALPALDSDLLTVLALGFGLFALINAGATFLRDFVLLSAGTTLGYGISVNVARRLLRLPVTWFERRHVGDVLSRFQSIEPIRRFLTEGTAVALLDGSMAIFTLIVMFFYSPLLAAIGIGAFLLYALTRIITFSIQRSAQEDAIAASGREQTMMIESLRGIVTLRLLGRETQRHALWQNRLMDSVNGSARLGRIDSWQRLASTIIYGIENVIVIWLAVGLVIEGGFSVGMVFAYVAYKTQFLAKSASLIDHWMSFKMLNLHLERLSDIALAEQDTSFLHPGSTAQLDGRIELRGVTFSYSPTDPVILDDVNLCVRPGEHVAITGASGGGKSTLVKMLLGLIQPDRGEILVDGKPLRDFGYKNFHEQIGAVLQDDTLFAGSLADNVAFFDDDTDMDQVTRCCRAAALHDDIAAMPMGYDTLVGDMGSSLSGGQRQRLLLARALYRNPRLMILDEGTSALDPARERLVNAEIAAMGITRIIIAHRLETLIGAQCILRMENGRLSDVTEEFATLKDKMQQAPDPTVISHS